VIAAAFSCGNSEVRDVYSLGKSSMYYLALSRHLRVTLHGSAMSQAYLLGLPNDTVVIVWEYSINYFHRLTSLNMQIQIVVMSNTCNEWNVDV